MRFIVRGFTLCAKYVAAPCDELDHDLLSLLVNWLSRLWPSAGLKTMIESMAPSIATDAMSRFLPTSINTLVHADTK